FARVSAASALATGSSCENSREKLRKRSLSATTAGAESRRSSSSRRSASASNLRRRVGVIGPHHRVLIPGCGREQALGGAGQVSIALQRGLAQGGGGGVQQAVGQAMGQLFQHFVRVFAGSQLLTRLGQQLGAGGFTKGAQLAD